MFGSSAHCLPWWVRFLMTSWWPTVGLALVFIYYTYKSSYGLLGYVCGLKPVDSFNWGTHVRTALHKGTDFWLDRVVSMGQYKTMSVLRLSCKSMEGTDWGTLCFPEMLTLPFPQAASSSPCLQLLPAPPPCGFAWPPHAWLYSLTWHKLSSARASGKEQFFYDCTLPCTKSESSM